ncbi:MAG: Hsp20/alpha crystallin family protein [Erysipelotrichaceae bacterium]|nr:Hsp20/alpha crystallin family protein [Erysipelotrichaceae bacterium]MDY6034042.1 Hsp20/alpha crystallin family protein [Bulleidia sp.]
MRYMTTRNHDLFNDMFDDVFRAPVFTGNNIMKTDVREKDGKYILEVEVPGYKKEDVKISLFNGNLTISASHTTTDEEKDAKGKILRQERFSGNTSRTFYVGDAIKDTDIQASFSDGILKIELPTEQKKEEETKKYIEIL